MANISPVSYTHLDVYKRQDQALAGAVVAVLSGVGDGVTHLGEAALVDEVNDCLLYTSLTATR